MRRILDIPLFVVLMGLSSLMMFLPVIFAVSTRDWLSARAFFYSALLSLILTALIAVATYARPSRSLTRAHLTALVAAFTVLPLMLAVPFYESVRNTTFLNAYFEMVSSLTTTGATLFEPGRLQPTLHLWRAMVGWMGGYMIWVSAIAILAPMNLGGFEVISDAGIGQGARKDRQIGQRADGDARERLARAAIRLLPIYVGLTLLLWAGLFMVGEEPLIALCHAMSTLSTSGISPVDGVTAAQSGFGGEALIFAFLVFAVSRQTFASDFSMGRIHLLRDDPEAQMGVYCVILIPTVLFLRHWIGAFEVDEIADTRSAILAFWGSAFTVLSFLTTTGFVSADWSTAQAWSGLGTPGLILVGLALVGGGVATTAGGVKLLRVFALYKHGVREMERLVHPSSVGGSGAAARRMRRKGAFVAWIFFMLFALSLSVIAVLLAATGLPFDASVVLSVAALSTTGPLAEVALEAPIDVALISEAGKMVLMAAMVLGRLETLALIALLNPEFWRS